MLINMKYKGKLQKLWGITVGFVFIVILTTRLFISKESTSASQGEAFLSDLSNNIIPSTDWGKFLLGFTIGISMESNNEVLNTKAIMISRILDEGGNFSIFNYIGLIKGLLIETFGRQLGGPFAEIMSLEVLNAFEEEEGNILMTTLPYSMAKFGFCLIWKTYVKGLQRMVRIAGLGVEGITIYKDCISRPRMISCGRRIGAHIYSIINPPQIPTGFLESFNSFNIRFSRNMKKYCHYFVHNVVVRIRHYFGIN